MRENPSGSVGPIILFFFGLLGFGLFGTSFMGRPTSEASTPAARLAQVLGDDFDIRAFHDQVLGAGALPLDLLESRIKNWVAEQKKEAAASPTP